jgi:hypothetical protein
VGLRLGVSLQFCVRAVARRALEVQMAAGLDGRLENHRFGFAVAAVP